MGVLLARVGRDVLSTIDDSQWLLTMLKKPVSTHRPRVLSWIRSPPWAAPPWRKVHANKIDRYRAIRRQQRRHGLAPGRESGCLHLGGQPAADALARARDRACEALSRRWRPRRRARTRHVAPATRRFHRPPVPRLRPAPWRPD